MQDSIQISVNFWCFRSKMQLNVSGQSDSNLAPLIHAGDSSIINDNCTFST